MKNYDPQRAPDPTDWQHLDESEQIELVLDFHRTHRIKLPNARLHAAAHVIVENQILLGSETPVAATLSRLMVEGLDRHDAVHAIGSVLSSVIWEVLQGKISADPNAPYYQELGKLTAAGWRSQA